MFCVQAIIDVYYFESILDLAFIIPLPSYKEIYTDYLCIVDYSTTTLHRAFHCVDSLIHSNHCVGRRTMYLTDAYNYSANVANLYPFCIKVKITSMTKSFYICLNWIYFIFDI
jgi:hypothetical protein